MPSKPNIMVIDDNNDIANLVKLALQRDGFNVDIFNDPLLALDYFKSNLKKFSVVISDIRMPGMSGIELIAKIKDLEPKVKVIFITAFDINRIKPELERYDYEIAEIFQKPFAMEDLSRRINKYCNND